MSPSATKTCPRCAEDVKAAALVCRYCGHEFDGGMRSRGTVLCSGCRTTYGVPGDVCSHCHQPYRREPVRPMVAVVAMAALFAASQIPDIGHWIAIAGVPILGGVFLWMSRRSMSSSAKTESKDF